MIIEVEEGLPEIVMADEIRLRQILLNLTGNAVKFTDDGYVKLKVLGEVSGKVAKITISVEDTGIGIAESDQKHIFEAFRQQYGQSSSKIPWSSRRLFSTSSAIRAVIFSNSA